MPKIEELKKKLEEDGFIHIYEWHDDPFVEYLSHVHKGRVGMYVLEGDLVFSLDGGAVTLGQGDYFEVPVGVAHIAKVGNRGCHFLVGEMIEGDS